MRNKKTIVMVSAEPTHPAEQGNRVRIRAVAEQFLALGHEVHFVMVNYKVNMDEPALRGFWGDRLHLVLRDEFPRPKPSLKSRVKGTVKKVLLFLLGRIRCLLGRSAATWKPSNQDIRSYYQDAEIDCVARVVKEISPDVVFLEYIFMARVFDQLPDSMVKVIDTHDVFTDRQYRHWQQGERSNWFSVSQDDEASALDRADYAIAIQEDEAAYFRSITSSVRVVSVGHFEKERAMPESVVCSPRLLLVASNAMNNIRGCEWFLEQVFPVLKAKLPTVHFTVAGKIKDVFPWESYADASVEFLGAVPDLDAVYEETRVVVSPQLAGTGLKIKAVDALGHGKPVVATTYGALGILHGSGSALIVKDDPLEFAEALVTVLEDQNGYAERCQQALRFVREMNTTNETGLQSVLAIQ
jgi:polysaccharide biosynthesis protein PslH